MEIHVAKRSVYFRRTDVKLGSLTPKRDFFLGYAYTPS